MNIWIPGWQFSEAAFHPLWSALNDNSPRVLNFQERDQALEAWLDEQAAALPNQSTLIGWSLGGMLACELAKRSPAVKRLIVLCANTQFSGGPGLKPDIAEPFRDRYGKSPTIMRKKFLSLISRHHTNDLANCLFQDDCSNTLNWLYQIRLASSLAAETHVLLADQDQLVPAQSANAAWAPIANSVTLVPGEHDLPFSQANTVADWITQYE